MKYWNIAILFVFLIVHEGCKKKTEQYTCPEVVSPSNHSSFHTGDTISIMIYLPSVIQKDSAWCFTQVYHNVNHTNGDAVFDTMVYPSYSNNFYGTVSFVLRTDPGKMDTFDIETGIGNAGAGLFCAGVTVYVQP